MKWCFFLFCLCLTCHFCMAQDVGKGFEIKERKAQKQVDILWNGKLMTSYCYYDSIRKPFLFPLNTIDGITVTRGYPVHPHAGERTDHPHHTGMWMNYESVNDLDFWNNSTAIPPQKRQQYGIIRHEKILVRKVNGNKATLIVTANWVQPDEKVLIKETTIYVFSIQESYFFIDRNSILTALGKEVVFKDAKDGLMAIRVARELEMPSLQSDVFVDARGNKTSVEKTVNNMGVTGSYTSSEGKNGDSVWGTKGRWAMLEGQKEGKPITIAIFDHPKNIGYPAYWHARGYGLFAVNPLGRKIFSNGTEVLNFTLKSNTSVSFHYKVLITSGTKITVDEMNRLANDFAKSRQ